MTVLSKKQALPKRQALLLVMVLNDPAWWGNPLNLLSMREKRIAARLKNRGLLQLNRRGGYALTTVGRVIATAVRARWGEKYT